jgi:hypothetical protein
MTPTSSGSRNGLVAWSVVATVLGLGGIIWGFISFAQANKAQDDLRAMQSAYNEVVDRPGLTGANVSALKEIAADADRGFGGMKLLDIAVQQKNAFSTLVAGTADDKKALADADAAVKNAQAAAGNGTTINGTSLVAALNSQTDHAKALQAKIDSLTADLEAANKSVQAALAEKAQIMAAADEKVAAALADAAESQKTVDAYAAAQDARTADVEGQNMATREELLKNGQELNQKILELQQQSASLQGQLDQANAERAKYRVPTNQILTAADGQITRTPGNDRVFINLGRGDQIAPGMTFEVYDKLGVPNVSKDDAADDKLLKGKASIEVIAPQQGISECRVVRTSPGATITEGDPILNVVYDRNVKFNFYVFGQFNLDYAGPANDRDTEIVKRLISGWGANVADQIDTKTDFVIIGQEPEVPTYTQEELANEPEKAFQKEQAEQALDTYTEVRSRANALNIPILNQTRFLYLIGYYDEAAR